jgi:hypothetical protein
MMKRLSLAVPTLHEDIPWHGFAYLITGNLKLSQSSDV